MEKSVLESQEDTSQVRDRSHSRLSVELPCDPKIKLLGTCPAKLEAGFPTATQPRPS